GHDFHPRHLGDADGLADLAIALRLDAERTEREADDLVLRHGIPGEDDECHESADDAARRHGHLRLSRSARGTAPSRTCGLRRHGFTRPGDAAAGRAPRQGPARAFTARAATTARTESEISDW